MSHTNVMPPPVNIRARRHARILPQQVQEWKAYALQQLGWASKTVEQTTTATGLTHTADSIRERSMRGQGPSSAEATKALLKGSSKEFMTYHDLRTAFETAVSRTPQMVAGLRQAAQGYIDHFAEHSKRQQSDPKNVSKKDACEATLKELARFDLADQVDALSPPPWDTATAMQAASLKTSLAISSLPVGQQRAETLGGGHASPAFWINQRSGGPTGKDKTFIFKPSCESDQPGFPNNGEPAREALGGRMAGMLNGALGFTLPVPETQVISVSRESLPPEALSKMIDDGKIADNQAYVGSVQQFEATDGEMREMNIAQRAQIPPRATQELAIFDTIMLNTDRHDGNFLKKDGPPPQLVPIDHGLSLPTREAETQITQNIGTTHNALLSLPGSHQPFTPEMQNALAQLDPDALANAMKRERATLEEVHPSTVGVVADESIELSRRSAMFLKRAATRLTPAAVQVGISRFNQELFDPNLDMNGFDALADSLITELEGQQTSMAEYFTMPPQMQRKMKNDLQAKGWDVGQFRSGNSILTNPAMAMRLGKSGVAKPDTARNPNRRPLDVDASSDAEVNAAIQAFPNTSRPNGETEIRAVVEDWREYQQLGGSPAKLREAVGLVGIRGDNVGEVYTILSKAVKHLKEAVSLLDVLDNDTTDDDLVDIRNGATYLEEILPALAPGNQQTIRQMLIGINVGLNGPNPMSDNAKLQAKAALARLRDPLTDAARARLLAKFDILINAAQDERTMKSLREDRFEVEAGGITGGYQSLKRRDPVLADAA